MLAYRFPNATSDEPEWRVRFDTGTVACFTDDEVLDMCQNYEAAKLRQERGSRRSTPGKPRMREQSAVLSMEPAETQTQATPPTQLADFGLMVCVLYAQYHSLA